MEIETPKGAAIRTNPAVVLRTPERRVVKVEDLTAPEIKAIGESRMDPRYDYPGALMEEGQ